MLTGVSLPGVWRASVDLLLPASCAGCGARGAACCGQCRAAWARPERVARGPTAAGPPLYALSHYRGVARRVLLAYKERGRRDLAPVLGGLFAATLPYLPEARTGADGTWWLVPAPSRPAAARARGGNHMLRVGRACAASMAAAQYPATVAPALRLGATTRDAVGLDRAQRAANLSGRLRVATSRAPPRGTPVVLVDDVVTTGATAAACVRSLATVGVEVTAVLALTVAG